MPVKKDRRIKTRRGTKYLQIGILCSRANTYFEVQSIAEKEVL